MAYKLQLPKWFKVGAEVFIGGNDRIIYKVISIDKKDKSWIGSYQEDKAKYPLDKVTKSWKLYEGLYVITHGDNYEHSVGDQNQETSKISVYYFTKKIVPEVTEYFGITDYKLEPKEYYKHCLKKAGKKNYGAIDIKNIEEWNKCRFLNDYE